MTEKSFISNVLAELPKRPFIKNSLIVGWILVLAGFAADLIWPNNIYWFQRAGAMLCMFSILSEFRLQQLDRLNLKKDWDKRINDQKYMDEPMFEEDDFYKGMKMLLHFSVAAGTVIWAFGDLLAK